MTDRDLLLRGGRVWGARRDADSVLLRGRRIAAVGRGEDLVSPRADVVDLDGRWVLPGFTDRSGSRAYGEKSMAASTSYTM